MKSDSAMKCRGRCNPREHLEYVARRVKWLRNPYERIQRVHGCTKRHGQRKPTPNAYQKVRACRKKKRPNSYRICERASRRVGWTQGASSARTDALSVAEETKWLKTMQGMSERVKLDG